MEKTNFGLLTQLQVAFLFLTRLPIPSPVSWQPDSLARAVWVFPIVGVVVGALCALIGWLGSFAALPVSAVALATILGGVLLSGGLHEDGLADMADGFGGGRGAEQKLAIMKDSRVGSYGVLALVFGVGLRATALAAVLPESPDVVALVLVAAHAGSRSAMPIVMWLMPLARRDGLAALAGRPSAEAVLVGVFIGAAAVLAGLGLKSGLMAFAAAVLAVAVTMLLARRQIGGYTGDILGAVQQLTETAILLVASRGLGN